MNLKEHRLEVKQQLEELLLRAQEYFIKEASFALDKKLVVQYKRQDQLRLLNLISWSEKYNLPLHEILTVLFKVWGGKYKTKSSRGLGVVISTICGPKSKQILLDYIKKQYPGGENSKLRKQEIINGLLPALDVSQREDPMFFILNYKNSLKAERKKIEDVEQKLKRRKWRGNPVY